MELDTELDLAEVAQRIGTSLEKLIRFGAHGKLTISVVSNKWPIHSENEDTETVNGLVHLVPADLLQSYTADFTLIRSVVTVDDKIVELVEPVKVLRGVLLVTANEFRRFRDDFGKLAIDTAETPPYLDSNHEWYSSQLAMAIHGWTALFSGGAFDAKGKSVKQCIEQWLSMNGDALSDNAKENIATLINPDKAKKGGAPSTPAK